MKLFTQFALLCCLGLPLSAHAQSEFHLQQQTLANPDNEPAPVHPVPSPRQLKWQETEFYAFFHYGMNTYTGLEWGNGDENENRFAPTRVPNPEQWLQAAKDAGMRGGIAVIKHHDGFCLWPTATTTHNATSSSNPNAKQTNIPRDFAEAARKLNMKYGFYISPWDRNSALYGTDRYVKEVFLRQCLEAAQYGNDQFEMWFDGANGGNGYYGGQNKTINVGDAEQGWAGETNWCMGDGTSGNIDGWYWHPGESDAKATNKGWFWHSGEAPSSPERLFQMYLETVGRNATLILNLPPDQSGALPTATVKAMTQLGDLLKQRFGTDLAKTATVVASETRAAGAGRNYDVRNLFDGNTTTYWATNDGTKQATLTFTWDSPQTLRYVDLMELVAKGQRVKKFKLEVTEDGTTWKPTGGNIATTTIGYKRIIPLNGNTEHSYDQGTRAVGLRITIEDAKACPLLKSVAIY